jgi:hypothetical protein
LKQGIERAGDLNQPIQIIEILGNDDRSIGFAKPQ